MSPKIFDEILKCNEKSEQKRNWNDFLKRLKQCRQYPQYPQGNIVILSDYTPPRRYRGRRSGETSATEKEGEP
jgi:hypothetical protein